ncbi:MAG: D-amino-acid transaminase [Rickettsiales bacterium]
MARIAYVNGQYVNQLEASVHIEDRGYQFSDGIYEYMAFYNRRLLDGDLHLQRMKRSLAALNIPQPMSAESMLVVINELIARNSREHGGLYIQITRGVARRDHPFPKDTKPSLVMTICAPKFAKPHEFAEGVKVITYPDRRWQRRDIKSVSLLANVLAKQEAVVNNVREAWLLRDGDTVSEASVSNAYIVDKDGTLITHPADEHILGGVTRDVVLRLARTSGVKVIERPFTMSEVKEAAEAFITSTSINILPVVKIDEHRVGAGKPGEVTLKLRQLYEEYIYKQTGFRRA